MGSYLQLARGEVVWGRGFAPVRGVPVERCVLCMVLHITGGPMRRSGGATSHCPSHTREREHPQGLAPGISSTSFPLRAQRCSTPPPKTHTRNIHFYACVHACCCVLQVQHQGDVRCLLGYGPLLGQG